MGLLEFKLPFDHDLAACVLYHAANDINTIKRNVSYVIDQIDHLNNPDLDGIAPSDDQALMFNLECLYKKLNEFQKKYKEELS